MFNKYWGLIVLLCVIAFVAREEYLKLQPKMYTGDCYVEEYEATLPCEFRVIVE